jgi:hypothetical protein
MLKVVTLKEIERIFAITDRLGISREMLQIPLGPKHPGRVTKLPSGKLEIVADTDFDAWLTTLEQQLRAL